MSHHLIFSGQTVPDIYPDAVNWADLSGSASFPQVEVQNSNSPQTISGIDRTITLLISNTLGFVTDGSGAAYCYLYKNDVLQTDLLVDQDCELTVNSGDTVYFTAQIVMENTLYISSSLDGTVTVKNLSASNVEIDSFSVILAITGEG